METPTHREPAVIDAMKQIFSQTGNGQTNQEAAFVVNGDGSVTMQPSGNAYGAHATLTIHPDTKAIFHVHPNNLSFYPSTPGNNAEHNGLGDTGLGKKYHIDVYTLNRKGLTKYDWRTDKVEVLYKNMDWSKKDKPSGNQPNK